MDDNSTLSRVMAEGGGAGGDVGHLRLLDEGAVVDGKWRVLALLGKGGNGEVYRVQHVKNGMLGALKVPVSGDSHLRDRFDRELDVLQQIATWQSSPASRHLPHLVDHGVVDRNVPYFVIEYLHPLKVQTRQTSVRKLVLDVSEAVGELHRNGYLHRDIKLENLMQRTNGDVVVIDFGLAGRIEEFGNPLAARISMTQGRVAGVGTVGSAAPEQLAGHASVQSDVFGLGALANDCFGGKPPRRWIPIIQKAQNSKPEYRFRNINEFVSAIRRDVPENGCRSVVRILLTVLPVVCVCVLALVYPKMNTAKRRQQESEREVPQKRQRVATDHKQQMELGKNDETWQEFVARRVQEEKPEIEKSIKAIHANLAEMKKGIEERQNEIATMILRDEVIKGVKWHYKIYYSSDKTFAQICSYGQFKGDLIIPAKLGGYEVGEIGEQAFRNCHGLISVKIPISVTSIGREAFDNCEKLNTVVLPESVVCIGDSAFRGCSALSSLNLPSNLVSIGNCAFDGCSRLAQVTIPPSVTNIGYTAFRNCKELAFISLPPHLQRISNSAFCNCTALTSVLIPQCVTNIGDGSFCGCSSIKSLNLPPKIAHIGRSAFQDCKGLDEIVIPDGVITIDDWAFSGCSALRSVSIPESVTRIGKYGFQSCNSIASISIPLGVKSISDSMFVNCRGLESFTIPPSVTNIGDRAFHDCESLKSIVIPSSVKNIGKWSFYRCRALSKVTIIDGVSTIGDGAFRNCERITTVRLPTSVTSIGKNTFDEHCVVTKSGDAKIAQ